jgi:hypothetical protein
MKSSSRLLAMTMPEHRRREQRQEREEAREVLVVRHVAGAVDEDQRADERDHHEHHRRERIEHPAELEHTRVACRELQPGEVEELPSRRHARCV